MLTNKNFSDIHTFGRASARWRYSSGGVLVQDAANVPSVDYDPVTLAACGLLVEEARTNLVLNSSVFTGWNVQGSTLSSPSMTAPDGGLARKLVSSVTASTVCQAYFPSVPTTAGSSYSFSSYFKAGEYTAAYLNTNLTGGYLSAVFDLLTGSTKSNAGLAASMAPAGNGWWRCTVTGAAASTAAQIAVGGASNYAGANVGTGPATGSVFDGVSGLYIWGAQFEAGPFASSYIPTTSAQATRAADSAILTDLSKIAFNPNEGLFVFDALLPFGATAGTSGVPRFGQVDDGTNNNRLIFWMDRIDSTVGGVTQGSAIGATVAAGVREKHAFGYSFGQMKLKRARAGVVSTATPTSLPAGISALRFMSASGTGAGMANGRLYGWSYIPRLPSDVEILNLIA